MNPWIEKALVLAGTVVMIAIRAPHGRRSRIVKVATSHKTPLETGLLVLAWVGFFVPLIWVASPAFSFAEYALGTTALVVGVMCLVIGLWLFYRSLVQIGRSPWRYASSIDSSRKAFIAISATRCTWR
jgi:protein-S-isoprenylcysteine O-methyltransferase Ste14